MERADYLAVAKQKSLAAVFDRLTEKAMSRFGLVAAWHFRRIVTEPAFGICSWCEKPVSAWTAAYLDPAAPDRWMLLWSTELPTGGPDTLWGELTAYARDFSRDTVLCSTEECGTVWYRLCRPETEQRAWVRVGRDGTVQTEGLALFFEGMPKKYRRPVPVLTGQTFSDGAEARAFLETAWGFPKAAGLEPAAVLKSAEQGTLSGPFRIFAFARAPEYLAYDFRTEYARVLEAAEAALTPLGYQRKNANLYRILDSGAYMECLQFQKVRFVMDPTHGTRFTVNVQWGPPPEEIPSWRPSDFRRMIAPPSGGGEKRIGLIARGRDHWYELHPGAETQAVIGELLEDLRRALDFLDDKRR